MNIPLVTETCHTFITVNCRNVQKCFENFGVIMSPTREFKQTKFSKLLLLTLVLLFDKAFVENRSWCEKSVTNCVFKGPKTLISLGKSG